MRVAVASHLSPDYLTDIVADGMVRLLGRGNVALDYVMRKSRAPMLTHLLEGFDVPDAFQVGEADILVASVRSVVAVESWRKNQSGRKVVILDGEDDDVIRDPWPGLVDVYFKREFFKGRPYPPNVRPLPFAAIPEAIPEVPGPRKGVFCLMGDTHPVRRETSYILAALGHFQPRPMDKDQYNRHLAGALVGVSPRGRGWDTYRYWETAYFGAALVAQRPQIEIPENFVDGEEAVFYDTPAELKERLVTLAADPDRAAAIGRASRAACLARHLSVNRARTVLEAVA